MNKRDRRRSANWQRIQKKLDHGRARKYLTNATPHKGLKVFKGGRVSSESQRANGNGKDQLSNLDKENEKLEYDFVGEREWVNPGDDLCGFKKTCKKARPRIRAPWHPTEVVLFSINTVFPS